MSTSSHESDRNHPGGGTVQLPYTPEQFRDFIGGLLGKPQTIERLINGPFVVTKDDIENLHHLIDQRVSSQNDATLIQFTCRIVYHDNSSVLLNSLPDFLSYREVKPLVSISVHPSWTYLIKFRNKTVPEKQQIDISFGARNTLQEIDDLFDHSTVRRLLLSHRSGGIFVRINHTDRSWGTDIEALLDGQLRTLVHTDSWPRQFVRHYSGYIGFGAGSALFASLVYTGWYIYTFLKATVTAQVQTLTSNQPVSLAEIAKLTRTILQYTVDNPMDNVIGTVATFGILALIGSVVFAGTIATYAESSRPSFVVLTAKTDENRSEVLKKDRNSWRKFILSACGGLVFSVAGNYLFYLILTHYLQ